MNPAHHPTPRSRPRWLLTLVLLPLLLALAACDQIAATLSPNLLPYATAQDNEVSLAAGQTVSVAVSVCPPQEYTTDLGYVFMSGSTVYLAVGELPRGVQARWDKTQLDDTDFGSPRLCRNTLLHLSADADVDLGAGALVELRAWSPSTANEVYATTFTLRAPTAAPPTPVACTADDRRTWQDQRNGLLASTADAVLEDAQLARAGSQLVAAWVERGGNVLSLRTQAWSGSDWRWAGPSEANGADEVEIEQLNLLGVSAPALANPETWLVYGSAAIPGVGTAHPMQLMARRLSAGQRFELAVPSTSIGSPQVMRAVRSRHGLHVAVVGRGQSPLQLWHADPDAANPAWTAITLPDGLDSALVRSVAVALDARGEPLLAFNRLDPIDGQWVERLQVWRLAAGGDAQAMTPAAPELQLQRRSVLPYGAGDLALMAGPSDNGPQALVVAWTAADSDPAHHVMALDGAARRWADLGNWPAHAAADRLDSSSFDRQLVPGCAGTPTLAWSSFGRYPSRHAWVARAATDTTNGWLTLGGGPAQGDVDRYGSERVSLVWDGIDGLPVALVLRNDFSNGRAEVLTRVLAP